jgi:hypothetical protein
MAETSPSFPLVREAVASFPGGFGTTDLAALASQDSLAAGTAAETPGSPTVAGMAIALIASPRRL